MKEEQDELWKKKKKSRKYVRTNELKTSQKGNDHAVK